MLFSRYLFEAAVEVKLPPVQVIGVKGEVIIFSAVTGVGQNVTAALSEAQEDVPVTDQRSRTFKHRSVTIQSHHFK